MFGWYSLGRTFVSTISKWAHSLNLTYIESLYDVKAVVWMFYVLSV